MTHEFEPLAYDKQSGLSDLIRQQLCRYFDIHENELPPEGLYGRILQEMERPLIEETMFRVGFNQVKAAKLLGLNRNTLRKKIKELNISLDRVL